LEPSTKLYYPSVTHVLDQLPKGFGFEAWLKAEGLNADKIKKDAAHQGSVVHNAITDLFTGTKLKWRPVIRDHGDGFIENEFATYTEKCWRMLLKFEEFLIQASPQIIAHEFKMVSLRIGAGGTLDLICLIKGELWLVDVKTSNYLWDSMWTQVGVYKKMWNWQLGDMYPIARHGILHLNSEHRGPLKNKIQGKGWVLREAPVRKGEDLLISERRYWNLWSAAKLTFDHNYAKIVDGKKVYSPKNVTMKSLIEWPAVEPVVESLIK